MVSVWAAELSQGNATSDDDPFSVYAILWYNFPYECPGNSQKVFGVLSAARPRDREACTAYLARRPDDVVYRLWYAANDSVPAWRAAPARHADCR